MWREFAASKGYVLHVCPRVDGKDDGCALLVRASRCRAPPEFTAFTFGDWGSRVLQVCTLSLAGVSEPLVLMHTHLTFPHASEHDPIMRRHQARKISELTRRQSAPCVVFGDLNGDVDDPALRVLTSLGGLTPLPRTTADGSRWVSHVAHTGALMACDLVLTRGGRRQASLCSRKRRESVSLRRASTRIATWRRSSPTPSSTSSSAAT